jgi:TolB-like protein/DNA-binding winged helix-turn-helix (wHTH) protein/Tfp pilus assembly protein PilF
MTEHEKRQPEPRVSFGPYRLDMENFQLWRGVQEVRLTGKALAVLHYLVEHAGELATKDELFAAAWPETVVSEATLVSGIQELRQALRDDAKNPRYIETVHRRGYRFIGKVVRSTKGVRSQPSGAGREEPAADGPEIDAVLPQAGLQALQTEAVSESPWMPASAGMTPLPSAPQVHNPSPQPDQALGASPLPVQYSWSIRSPIFLGLALLASIILIVQYLALSVPSPQSLTPSTQPALPLPDKPSIIVLPLVNLSGDPAQEYFSDGLTEVLTGDLSRISSLFVISRNSAFTYKGKAVKVQDVSKEMGVRYVLEGSVQRADQRVRITVQLIDATTGYHVWSQQYDRPLQDLFALQDEIVQKIVTTLKLQLTLQEQGYIVHRRTDNLEAYDAFLRGAEYHYRITQEATAQARQLFEKALALDPQYAEAYASLGYTYWVEWLSRWSADPQTLERVSELAQRALALDDSLPMAHSLLGIFYSQKHQYDQAIAQGERAITLDPNFADSYAVQAEVLIFAGRPEEALQAVEQAMRLNPRCPPWYLVWLGLAYQMTGRYAEAIATWKELLSRSPTAAGANLLLAVSYVEQWAAQQNPDLQTLAQAEAAVQRALALNASDPLDHANLGVVYLGQKQYEQALAEIERAIASNVNLAEIYALLAAALGRIGRVAEAIAMAEQALRRKPYSADHHLNLVGAAYYFAGRPEEALAPLKQFIARYPNILGAHLTLAAVYSELGKEAEAHAEATEVLRINPKFSLEVHKQRTPIKDPAMLERHIAALRRAGLK